MKLNKQETSKAAKTAPRTVFERDQHGQHTHKPAVVLERADRQRAPHQHTPQCHQNVAPKHIVSLGGGFDCLDEDGHVGAAAAVLALLHEVLEQTQDGLAHGGVVQKGHELAEGNPAHSHATSDTQAARDRQETQH